jgi:hypothetical protein
MSRKIKTTNNFEQSEIISLHSIFTMLNWLSTNAIMQWRWSCTFLCSSLAPPLLVHVRCTPKSLQGRALLCLFFTKAIVQGRPGEVACQVSELNPCRDYIHDPWADELPPDSRCPAWISTSWLLRALQCTDLHWWFVWVAGKGKPYPCVDS